MPNTAVLKDNVAAVAAFCEKETVLQGAHLGGEYFYQSLPLCVIDAVYSIGVRYEGVQNVVRRYCDVLGSESFVLLGTTYHQLANRNLSQHSWEKLAQWVWRG